MQNRSETGIFIHIDSVFQIIFFEPIFTITSFWPVSPVHHDQPENEPDKPEKTDSEKITGPLSVVPLARCLVFCSAGQTCSRSALVSPAGLPHYPVL